jgi:predicted nuclease of predicted toxin-antitoxin system
MQLRFLLDEDTERRLKSELSKAGHDVERVVTVDELGTGSDDTEVREYAVETDRIIVTHDDDFLTFSHDSHAGVFYVPDQRLSAHQIFSIIQAVADAYESREQIQSVVYLTEKWL